jgi:hypothetical protein
MQELFLLSRSPREKSMVKTKLEHQKPIKMYISTKRETNNPSILRQIAKKNKVLAPPKKEESQKQQRQKETLPSSQIK